MSVNQWEKWRQDLQALGGWDNELVNIPAGAVRKMIEAGDAAIAHADALEARLAQAYGLLRRYQFVTIQPDDALHDALWDDTARYLAPKMPNKEQPSE